MLAFWFSLTEFGSKQVPGCPPQSPHTGVLSACALATRCATNPHSDPTAIAWGFGLADAMEARHAMVNILLPFGFVGLGDSDSDSGEGCNDDGHFGDECDSSSVWLLLRQVQAVVTICLWLSQMLHRHSLSMLMTVVSLTFQKNCRGGLVFVWY